MKRIFLSILMTVLLVSCSDPETKVFQQSTDLVQVFETYKREYLDTRHNIFLVSDIYSENYLKTKHHIHQELRDILEQRAWEKTAKNESIAALLKWHANFHIINERLPERFFSFKDQSSVFEVWNRLLTSNSSAHCEVIERNALGSRDVLNSVTSSIDMSHENGLYLSRIERTHLTMLIESMVSKSGAKKFNDKLGECGLNDERFELVVNEFADFQKETHTLLDKLKNGYFQTIRKNEGIWSLPNGKLWYKHLVDFYSGTEYLDITSLHAKIYVDFEAMMSKEFKGGLVAPDELVLLSSSDDELVQARKGHFGLISGFNLYAQTHSKTYHNLKIAMLAALLDSGVHFDGWSVSQARLFVRGTNLVEEDHIEELIGRIVLNPGKYAGTYVVYKFVQTLVGNGIDDETNLSSLINLKQRIEEVGLGPISVIALGH